MFKSMMSNWWAGMQGRHTAFVSGFFAMGNIMHWFHRLDAMYITFMCTLMSFILGHSVQENIFATKDPTKLNPPPG